MRLVVDTNRIIAALIKNGASRRILTREHAEFITISFSEKEIQEHKEMILSKSEVPEEVFEIVLNMILEKTTVLDDDIVKMFMPQSSKIMDGIDADDTPFIAAALATGSDIWSDDAHFKKQKKVRVHTTKEVLQILEK